MCVVFFSVQWLVFPANRKATDLGGIQVRFVLLGLRIELVPALDHWVDDLLEQSVTLLVATCDADSKMWTQNTCLDRVRERVTSAGFDVLELLEQLRSEDLRAFREDHADRND